MKYIKTYEGLFDFFKKKETDPKKIEIIKLCTQYNITKYTINDDYSIDVDGHVDLANKELTKIPIKFNKVTGYFSCVGNQLVDLENAPRRVERNFMCQHQYYGSFISLKGAPEYVGFRFDFNDNENLKDFTDFPTYVGATIDAKSTGLYSFDCIPESAKVIIDEDTPLFAILRCVSSPIFPILGRNGGREIFIDTNGESSEAIETFKAYDPIHPPKNEGDKPILYMDRFRMLLVEIEKKSISNLLYSKDNDSYRMIEKHYDIRNNEYKIEEGLFDYFKKENKDKRTKIREIKEGLIKLINNSSLRIDNNWSPTLIPVSGKGNTCLNTNHGKFWININDDFTVDVAGNVGIRFGYDIKDFPCKFNRINGNFFIELSFAIDDFIDKFPERVEGKLSITNCGLDSLKDLPTKYVGKDFDCSSNNLQTFEGLPEYIGGDLNAESNDIYTCDFLENFEGAVSLYLNPVQYVQFRSGNFIQTLQEILTSNSENDIYDLFKSCDPIHPPLKKYGKPIIYLNRMDAFANELDIKLELRDSVKQYYDVR